MEDQKQKKFQNKRFSNQNHAAAEIGAHFVKGLVAGVAIAIPVAAKGGKAIAKGAKTVAKSVLKL